MVVTLCLCMSFMEQVVGQPMYRVQDGTVRFESDAPLEYITANSTKLRGIIHPERRTFAFTVDIETFEGFNSPLQRIHFNENYMETRRYPTGTFSGKFIEDIDLMADGEYEVRVKGMLNLHGVEKERIIKAMVRIRSGEILVDAHFNVLLEDHAIRIPKVVQQKIARMVDVDVRARFVLDSI